MTTLVRFLKIVTIGTAKALRDKKPVISMAQKSKLTGNHSLATFGSNRLRNFTVLGTSFLAANRHSKATEFCAATTKGSV